jgi:hypothetical protein
MFRTSNTPASSRKTLPACLRPLETTAFAMFAMVEFRCGQIILVRKDAQVCLRIERERKCCNGVAVSAKCCRRCCRFAGMEERMSQGC